MQNERVKIVLGSVIVDDLSCKHFELDKTAKLVELLKKFEKKVQTFLLKMFAIPLLRLYNRN